MPKDVAGNYTFSVDDNDYRIMRMDVFKQREVIGYLQPIMNENGEIKIFGKDSEETQDYLFPLISFQDGDNFIPLTKDFLPLHTRKFAETTGEIDFMMGIFTKAVGELSGHFFPQGDTSAPANSNQTQETSPENTVAGSENQNALQKTLNK